MVRDEELSVMGAAVNPAPMTDWQRAELRRVWEASLRRRHPGCVVVFERNTPDNVTRSPVSLSPRGIWPFRTCPGDCPQDMSATARRPRT